MFCRGSARRGAAPDGVLVSRSGKRLEIRRDTDQATGQMQLMAMDAQSIQKAAGRDENPGPADQRDQRRGDQGPPATGSVVTTEPFDNLRMSVQLHGEKALSLVEQFTGEKVFRLTGARGARSG